MVNAEHVQLLEQILALLDTACEAGVELLERYAEGNPVQANQLLEDLMLAVGMVQAAQEPLLPQLEHSYTHEMLENIQDTLEDIRSAIQEDRAQRAAMRMEFQLLPFLRQLKEAFYFWGGIYPDREKMERYYREEFADHYQNFYVGNGMQPRYRVCIVVVAYNHLEMTKQCVESILKHTDLEKLNAQLILVDHGSTDGVLEYFESLGVGQVIHYKANMRGTMFCALPQICDSEYYLHVANDTVVTKDWLDILLKCADSDKNIAAVVPATCNISNLQGANVPVSDCDALVQLAEQHNISNPRLWSDRARVLPVIGMFRVSALNKIGFWDPLFYTFDFMDDDFSLRARRAGYRQILCEDVMCYHRGSATVKDVQAAEDTLGDGRRLFMMKHGVDAWGVGMCYDFNGLRQFSFAPESRKNWNILGLDCGFGDSAMEIRNRLRRVEKDGRIFHITVGDDYLPDLKNQAEGVVCTAEEKLASAVEDSFPDIQFDALYLERRLERCPNPYRLLKTLAERTAPGGQLAFSFSNPYSAVQIYQLLHFSLPDAPLCLLSPEQVGKEARKYFSSVEFIGAAETVGGLEEFIVRHYGKEFLKNSRSNQLKITQYYVRCVK